MSPTTPPQATYATPAANRRERRQISRSRTASPVIKSEPVSPTYRPSTTFQSTPLRPELPRYDELPHGTDYASVTIEDGATASTFLNFRKENKTLKSTGALSPTYHSVTALYLNPLRPQSPHNEPPHTTDDVSVTVNGKGHADSPSDSSKENNLPKSTATPRLRLILKRPSRQATFITPENRNVATIPNTVGLGTSSSGSSSSGLTLKLRCIQAALKEPLPNALTHIHKTKTPLVPGLNTIAGRKHTAAEDAPDDDDDTDSEIELFPSKPRRSKAAKPLIKEEVKDKQPFKNKRSKITHMAAAMDDDAMFDAGDEDESPSDDAGQQLSLVTPVMKRNKRILNPNNPEHAKLIAGATKAGADYYDSDADDLPGNVKDTNKPHLFRNVTWGTQTTDYSSSADFSKESEFTQFVPGRFELQPDGTVADQKAKLIVKLTDKTGRKRIFANPPPRDWHNQEAITALNKRTVQQIRRNTNVRFREVVQAYVPEERRWILANLTNGKPSKGWKVFVQEFNEKFQGKVLHGVKGTRPYRSHSSLTKEVERFGPEWYAKGLVPVPTKKGKKE
ncbi:Nn.00g042970.m01.CDS01 [Neocucurbitaria sp. VM-36]